MSVDHAADEKMHTNVNKSPFPIRSSVFWTDAVMRDSGVQDREQSKVPVAQGSSQVLYELQRSIEGMEEETK